MPTRRKLLSAFFAALRTSTQVPLGVSPLKFPGLVVLVLFGDLRKPAENQPKRPQNASKWLKDMAPSTLRRPRACSRRSA